MDTDTPKAAFDLASKAFREKRYSDAFAMLRKLEKSFPNEPEILYGLATCSISLGDHEVAREMAVRLDKLSDVRGRRILELIDTGSSAGTRASEVKSDGTGDSTVSLAAGPFPHESSVSMRCASCKKRVSVPAQFEGKTWACSQCGKTIDVPASRFWRLASHAHQTVLPYFMLYILVSFGGFLLFGLMNPEFGHENPRERILGIVITFVIVVFTAAGLRSYVKAYPTLTAKTIRFAQELIIGLIGIVIGVTICVLPFFFPFFMRRAFPRLDANAIMAELCAEHKVNKIIFADVETIHEIPPDDLLFRSVQAKYSGFRRVDLINKEGDAVFTQSDAREKSWGDEFRVMPISSTHMTPSPIQVLAPPTLEGQKLTLKTSWDMTFPRSVGTGFVNDHTAGSRSCSVMVLDESQRPSWLARTITYLSWGWGLIVLGLIYLGFVGLAAWAAATVSPRLRRRIFV